MASHHCPDGYTPIRHKNTKGFLWHNIRHPSTGASSIDEAMGKTCVPTANICDDATMTFQGGRCVSTVDITEDNASVCGRGTKYNEETQQCEKDGGCAIM